jgi:hypothetical protein
MADIQKPFLAKWGQYGFFTKIIRVKKREKYGIFHAMRVVRLH